MQHGNYITDRRLVSFIKDICRQEGYECQTYSDDWVIEIKHGDKSGKIFGYKFSLNNSASAHIAQDKVASYQILSANDIPAIAHYLVRTKANSHDIQLPGEVVLKPLVGTSGHMVRAFNSVPDAMRYIATSSVESWAISPRHTIAEEIRILILDQDILLAYSKTNPSHCGTLPLFNLGQGAVPQDIIPDKKLVDLALSARNALGLRLCSVDIAKLDDGSHTILEVNDGIMTEHYSRHSPEYAHKARVAYASIIHKMMS